MGNPKGFMTIDRKTASYLPVGERVRHYDEVLPGVCLEDARAQGARCMDCGIPFCHGPSGCPLGNLIPVFNELLRKGDIAGAIRALHATNNFPEFTGRVCPAPCESACTLGINRDPVTIKQNERSIIDLAWEAGLIRPEPPEESTGKRVAVVGSGPAGLAAAQQLRRAGHAVTVYERAERPGGLLRYGIPDFKMGKPLIDRRVEQMTAEGVVFRNGVEVGSESEGGVSAERLLADSDAVLLAAGSTVPRDLPVPGRDLAGIHFAMDYLTGQNRACAGGAPVAIDASGKRVIVIGGGDTGSDCIGTAVRQGARSVVQLEIMPRPAEERTAGHPWPYWPFKMSVTSSHEEAERHAGLARDWCISTSHFEGDGEGRVARLVAERVEWAGGRMRKAEGGRVEIEADLVLLALGFLHPEKPGLIERLGVELDARGNVRTDATMQTSRDGVYAAGDARRGQSLVVWALAEGRDAAYFIDRRLMGESCLPRPNVVNLRPK